jgi:signal transduction histidine kinase
MAKGSNHLIARTLLPLLLPWWLLVPLTTVLLYRGNMARELAHIEHAQEERIEQDIATLEGAIVRLTSDIRLVRRMASTAFDGADEHTGETRLATFLFNFLEVHPGYRQARLLGPDCVERVRLERDPAGPPRRVAERALQDKSARPYCSRALALRDRAYLSPLDANIEHGQVVHPIEPMLRISKLASLADGQPLGVVVLNLDASDILAAFQDSPEVQMALLNDQGEWLRAPDPNDAFALARDLPEQRLPARYPAVWAAVSEATTGRGQMLLDSGLWTYRRLAPPTGANLGESPSWVVLAHTPADLIGALRHRLLTAHLLVGTAALLALTVLSMALSTSQIRQLRTARALERSNADLAGSLARLQASLEARIRSEKLASLGLLVAGVAHEMGTPLGSALLSLEALEEQLETLRDAHAAGLRESELNGFMAHQGATLALLEANLSRASALIRQFKAVAAERADATRQPFELATLVRDLLTLMQGELRRSPVRIEVDIPPGLILNSYPGPLGQLIQNLVTNALLHAFAPGQAGEIRIGAKLEGDQVAMTVRDDGCGIPDTLRERIWDPFFTTRRSEGGTGLGLHICQQIAHNVLGGNLTLRAPQPGGTEMLLRIPLEAPEPAPRTSEAPPPTFVPADDAPPRYLH